MIKSLFSLLLIFSCFPSPPLFAQSDIRGEWFGNITQEPTGISDNYTFSLSLNFDGQTITGLSFIQLIEEPENYGWMELEGKWENGKLELIERHIVDQNLYSFAYWCQKTLFLELTQEDGQLFLIGNWESGHCNGSSGQIFLRQLMI